MSKKTRQRMASEEISRLIDARVKLDSLFTSKFFDKKEAWVKVKDAARLDGFSTEQIKMKWGNLWKKYKDLLHPPTGRGTEDDGEFAGNWEFFDAMHAFAESQHTVNPPMVVDSSGDKIMRVNPRNSFGGSTREDVFEHIEYLDEEIDNITINRNLSATTATNNVNLSVASTSQSDQNASTSAGTSQRKRKYSQQEMFEYFRKQDKRRKKESKALFGILAALAIHDNIEIPNVDLDTSSDSE